MALSFTTLDVFTSTPFKGNPLAIIHVPNTTSLTQTQKQLLARQFNLSETVLLCEQTEEDLKAGEVRIGIFTTTTELPFAGHPTIGSAVYLLEYLKKRDSVAALQTKAGRIPIEKSDDGKSVKIAVAHNVHIHTHPFVDHEFGTHPVTNIVKGMNFILINLPTLEDLARRARSLLPFEEIHPDMTQLDPDWRTGFIGSLFYVDLGTSADGTRLLRTRMLSSSVEDPATGSASCALCYYLSLTENGSNNSAARTVKYQLTQGVEMGRKSDIYVEVVLREDGQAVENVFLMGTAVKVMDGQVAIPGEDVTLS